MHQQSVRDVDNAQFFAGGAGGVGKHAADQSAVRKAGGELAARAGRQRERDAAQLDAVVAAVHLGQLDADFLVPDGEGGFVFVRLADNLQFVERIAANRAVSSVPAGGAGDCDLSVGFDLEVNHRRGLVAVGGFRLGQGVGMAADEGFDGDFQRSVRQGQGLGRIISTHKVAAAVRRQGEFRAVQKRVPVFPLLQEGDADGFIRHGHLVNGSAAHPDNALAIDAERYAVGVSHITRRGGDFLQLVVGGGIAVRVCGQSVDGDDAARAGGGPAGRLRGGFVQVEPHLAVVCVKHPEHRAGEVLGVRAVVRLVELDGVFAVGVGLRVGVEHLASGRASAVDGKGLGVGGPLVRIGHIQLIAGHIGDLGQLVFAPIQPGNGDFAQFPCRLGQRTSARRAGAGIAGGVGFARGHGLGDNGEILRNSGGQVRPLQGVDHAVERHGLNCRVLLGQGDVAILPFIGNAVGVHFQRGRVVIIKLPVAGLVHQRKGEGIPLVQLVARSGLGFRQGVGALFGDGDAEIAACVGGEHAVCVHAPAHAGLGISRFCGTIDPIKRELRPRNGLFTALRVVVVLVEGDGGVIGGVDEVGRGGRLALGRKGRCMVRSVGFGCHQVNRPAGMCLVVDVVLVRNGDTVHLILAGALVVSVHRGIGFGEGVARVILTQNHRLTLGICLGGDALSGAVVDQTVQIADVQRLPFEIAVVVRNHSAQLGPAADADRKGRARELGIGVIRGIITASQHLSGVHRGDNRLVHHGEVIVVRILGL